MRKEQIDYLSQLIGEHIPKKKNSHGTIWWAGWYLFYFLPNRFFVVPIIRQI